MAAAAVLLLGALAWLGAHDRELPHFGGDVQWDRSYMRRMAAHHAQGVDIARLAAERAQEPRLRALARMMIATQDGEIALLSQWWRSWFDDPPVFVCSEAERAAMPGMLDAARLQALRAADGAAFDAAFVDAMSFHHRGAIAMADEALRRAGDPRLKLMSHAIVHEQRGDIALMHGIGGIAAVALATQAMLAPAGEHPADRPGRLRDERSDEQRRTAGQQ